MPITLYHYTTKDGATSILQNRIINQSKLTKRARDAVFGPGVYLTALSPEEGKLKIVMNNWGADERDALEMIFGGRVDYCIKVVFPSNDRNLERCQTTERNIYRYIGDLYLSEYQYQGLQLSTALNF